MHPTGRTRNVSGQRAVRQHHSSRANIVGTGPRHVPPAWREQQMETIRAQKQTGGYLVTPRETGSKIYITNLPFDVSEEDLRELFHTTIGPLQDCFIICNSQGRSKGKAVVAFERARDALRARKEYNHKTVDNNQRTSIRIDIIVDSDIDPSKLDSQQSRPMPVAQPPPKPHPLTLIDRLAPSPIVPEPRPKKERARPQQQQQQQQPRQHVPQNTAPLAARAPLGPRARVRKGPRRTKKLKASLADLDREMEEYQMKAPVEGVVNGS